MSIDEAARILVDEYKTITKPNMSGFSAMVTTLGVLYPEVPTSVVMHEVVRHLAPTVHRQH